MNYYNPDKYIICNEHAIASACNANNKLLSQDKDNNDKDFFYMTKKNNAEVILVQN